MICVVALFGGDLTWYNVSGGVFASGELGCPEWVAFFM